MEFEQAVKVVSDALQQKIARPLTEAEVSLLFGAWNNWTYDRIAEGSGYTINYLQRDVGPKFWKLLSDALGRQVNKKTLRAIVTNFDGLISHTRSLTPHPTLNISSTKTQLLTQTDWGEALDITNFHGRDREVDTLTRWVVSDRCSTIALVGMGGMGKSALATKVARDLQGKFEFVIWRSLRNAPSLETLLTDLVPFLSNQQEGKPELTKLLDCWRKSRCLVVLDNLETLLNPERVGQFRAGFEDYEELLRLATEVEHKSCILLTSREKPALVATLEGVEFNVRSLKIDGSPEAARMIIQSKGLVGTEEQVKLLGDRYSNCPLALKIVATSIQELFNGSIGDFLQEDTLIFNGIRRLLDRQFQRLSALEKSLMYWLAINREWTSLAELQTDIVPAVSKGKLLESLEALSFRCLIEKQGTQFTQQPVVMEYITEQILDLAVSDLEHSTLDFLFTHALLKATAKDYIREAQRREIIEPLCDRLLEKFGHQTTLIQHLQQQLEQLHPSTPLSYGAGNIINLLCHLQANLTGANWSGLTIRQAYFTNTPLHRVNLTRSSLLQSVFAESITDILGLSFSPDGTLLAMLGKTGMLFIYHIPTGRWLHSLSAHCGWSLAVCFAPNSHTLFTSGFDQTIKQWDGLTGKCLRSWQTNSVINHIALSPDGQLLASAHGDNTIQIWHTQTCECIQNLPAHTGVVMSVDFHPHRPWLLSTSVDCTIKLWDYTTGECLQTISAHSNTILDGKFNPQGTCIASMSNDGSVKLWSVATGECIQTLAIGAINFSHALGFSPDGRILACPKADAIACYDVASGKLIRVLPLGVDIWNLQFSPDGKTLVSAAHTAQVKFWDVDSGQCWKTLQGEILGFWSLAFNPRSMGLLSGSEDGQIRLWDVCSGNCLVTKRSHSMRIAQLACHPQLPLTVSCGYDGTIRIWNEVEYSSLLLTQQESWVTSIAFHPHSPLLVSAGLDSTITFWQADTGISIEKITLPGTMHTIYDLAIDPTGNTLAGGSENGSVQLWDVESRQILKELSAHQSRVWTVAFHPQECQLASGGHDGKVKLWDIDTGNCIKTWDVIGSVMSVAFSPDGEFLAASSDSTIYLWDLKTQECLTTFTGHTNVVSSILFHSASPDSSLLLISASYDDTIRYWDTSTGECVKILRPDRLYEGMDITGIEGLCEGQKAMLKQLGAVG